MHMVSNLLYSKRYVITQTMDIKNAFFNQSRKDLIVFL